MTPNPAEFWYGAGVVVNVFLGAVAAFAFKASRDSATYARQQADAANAQTQIALDDANRVRSEAQAALSPMIFGYIHPDGLYDYYNIHVVNASRYNIVFLGISARLKFITADTVEFLPLHASQIRMIVDRQNPSPLCLVDQDYWLGNLSAQPDLTGYDYPNIEYSATFMYLSPERKYYEWKFELVSGIGPEPFLSADKIVEIPSTF